jgi:uroporphyrin-III C-methyltransferase
MTATPTLPFPALPSFEPGTVWLVGAGPGDPGLITLLAQHALSHADVIVYDALVDERILALANPDARLEYAGKRGGRPSPRQPDISLSLIAHARGGLRVLRLKGGDPFVFGRGGEEALALAEAGIRFRVVPGVTAGVGGLAYAGIPVTHRDTNQAVTFVTGHDMAGNLPGALNWTALAQGSPVIVFYMALGHLPEIVARLLEAGRKPDEPVAIVSKATTPEQRVLVSRLASVIGDCAGADIPPPAMVVVGSTVALRDRLDWLPTID